MNLHGANTLTQGGALKGGQNIKGASQKWGAQVCGHAHIATTYFKVKFLNMV